MSIENASILKKTNLLKTELLLKLQKSISQNNNIKTQIKLYSILQFKKKKTPTYQNNTKSV